MASKAIEINIVGSYNDKDVKRAMRDLEKLSSVSGASGSSIGQQFAKLADGMEKAGKNLTAAVTLPVVGIGAASLAAFTDQETAIAKMESVIKSTGGVAGVSSEHIQNLASSLQKTTTFADETTVGAAALALTFKSLRNEAGAGNDIFDRTIKASQDMATVMGTDLNSATMMISKALNEPAEGLSKLSRAGVQFTAEQENMVKQLVASGDTMGAQKIILGELESQFGGAAEAVANTTEGKLKQGLNNLGEAAEKVGQILAPALNALASWLTKIGAWFERLTPQQQKLIVIFAGIAAAVGPVLIVGAKLIGAFQALMPVFKAVKAMVLGLRAAMLALNASMLANPVVLIIVGIVALIAILVVAYKKFEGFRNVVDAIFRAIATVAKWLWSNVIQPVFTWIAGIFTKYVIPAAIAFWAAAKVVFEAIGKVAQWLWNNVLKPVFGFIGAVIVNVIVPYIKFMFKIWQEIFKAIGVVAQWLWNNVLKPVFDFIGAVIVNVIVPYIKHLWQVWSMIFKAIAAVAQWLWNTILKPVFDFIGQVISGIIIPIFVTLGAIFGLIWNGIAAAVSWVWGSVLQPIFNFIGQVISGIIIPIFVTLGAIFGLIWQGIAAAVSWVWGNVLSPIWNAIVAVIQTVLMPVLSFLGGVFASVWNAIVGAVQRAWGILSGVFNTIKNAFQDVANFFGDKVGQIIGFFGGIADAIGGAFQSAFNRVRDWWNRILGGKGFKAPEWLGGAEFRIPTLAKGGMVPGLTGTPVLAMLHAGERVLRRDEQRTMGAGSDASSVNVYVNKTDADPYEIGREILWTLKVAG